MLGQNSLGAIRQIMNLSRLAMRMGLAALVFGLLAGVSSAQALAANKDGAASQTKASALLAEVGIDQKLNQQIPLDLSFRDEAGKTVKLGDYFGEKPVILTLVYYQCPMLCTQVLNAVERGLTNVSLDIGKQFQVVTVSIDPRETPQLARTKKNMYVGLYGRAGAGEGWHFLTGDEPQIKQLAKAAGFRYAYDPQTGQFAHASGIMLLTPEGKLSRYFYGIQYPSRDLRLGLVEASEGRIGTPVDQVLLYCFHYDPATGKYGMVIQNVIRGAGVLTVMIIGMLVFVLSRRGGGRGQAELREHGMRG
jgi:protein SCO1/2